MAENEILQKLTSIEAMLTEQSLSTKRVLSFKEAAKFLDLSPSYLYKLTSRGLITHYKPAGKRIVFTRDDLFAYMLQNRVKPAAEIEAEASTIVTLRK